MMSQEISRIHQERLRRRTFAIISHPDAGKTTLTEKLLLFGGSIEIAGAVRGRKSQRAAKSDWMELEKQRGISVSSTVLTFEYEKRQFNLLDTPGHHDFSEDTYRTLMAADAAIMVIDAAKGIETQTEKLFRVCAARKIPVVTFVNKVDRPGPSPLEILAGIEQKFSIEAIPVNWPVSSPLGFIGLVDLEDQKMHLYRERSGEYRERAEVRDWQTIADNPQAFDERPLQITAINTAREEIELLELAGHRLQRELFLQGKQSPVYFGSALTNYGIELFLKGFMDTCPPPGENPETSSTAELQHDEFSGFVFKIQANLDPQHRDRVAFLRVCTGRFERDMDVTVARSLNRVRLPRALKIFGRERQTMDEAFPGDIIGVVCPGEIRLGDTLYQGTPISFPGVPQFPPEVFARVTCPDTSRRKQFDRGMQQLVEEGAIQMFRSLGRQKESILAAVGELQFDVVKFRLESEYQAPSRIEWLPYKIARWWRADDPSTPPKIPYSARLVQDSYGSPAVLMQTPWDLKTLIADNPNYQFDEIQESRALVQ
jgi:peptide chain release factor 3